MIQAAGHILTNKKGGGERGKIEVNLHIMKRVRDVNLMSSLIETRVFGRRSTADRGGNVTHFFISASSEGHIAGT